LGWAALLHRVHSSAAAFGGIAKPPTNTPPPINARVVFPKKSLRVNACGEPAGWFEFML